MDTEADKGSSVQMQEEVSDIPRCPKYREEKDDFPPHQHTDRMIRAIKRERTEE